MCVSLFFATLGFGIPLPGLFEWQAIGYGLLFTILSILAKYVTGL